MDIQYRRVHILCGENAQVIYGYCIAKSINKTQVRICRDRGVANVTI